LTPVIKPGKPLGELTAWLSNSLLELLAAFQIKCSVYVIQTFSAREAFNCAVGTI